jgi:hypothetical protein
MQTSNLLPYPPFSKVEKCASVRQLCQRELLPCHARWYHTRLREPPSALLSLAALRLPQTFFQNSKSD